MPSIFTTPKVFSTRFVAGREDFLACWRFEWILKYGGLGLPLSRGHSAWIFVYMRLTLTLYYEWIFSDLLVINRYGAGLNAEEHLPWYACAQICTMCFEWCTL